MSTARRLGMRAAAMVLGMVLAAPGTARAGNPEMARYSDDPDRTFWFMMITDSHIDTFLAANEEDHLRFAVGEAFDTIMPWFVVLTGDVTDHTDGVNYFTSDNTDEWLLYRNIVDAAGMDETILYDLPGNHDFYGNEGEFYLAHSIQGQTQDTTQPQWVLDLPFGKYHFISLATPHNDSPPQPWPMDNVRFSDEEVAEVEYDLLVHTDANLTLSFGHHDLEAAANADAMRTVLQDYGVVHYGHGHEHDVGYREGSGIIRYRLGTLGQGDTDNIGVWAVDNDAVSIAQMDVTSAWPMVVITAPVDSRLGDVENPYAPTVPATCTEAPVRVLGFDATGITEIYFTIDDGALEDLTANPATTGQYLGSFDATDLAVGEHTLQVHVEGTAGWRQFSSQFVLEDRECDLEPTVVEPDPEPVPEVAEHTPEMVEPVPETGEDATTDTSAPDVEEDVTMDTEEDPSEEWVSEGGSVAACGCSMVY